MDIKQYEKLVITQLNDVVGKIINNSPKLAIAVKKGERVGDGVVTPPKNRTV